MFVHGAVSAVARLVVMPAVARLVVMPAIQCGESRKRRNVIDYYY